jgi:hypothetical protein
MKCIRTVTTLLSMLGLGPILTSGCGNDDPATEGKTNTCVINDDCADSQAAEDYRLIRCSFKEIYCLGGECVGECQSPCEVARDDVSPCEAPRQCRRTGGSEDVIFACTMLPIACESTADCPLYRPSVHGGAQAEWSCEDGECRYPGLEYPTR